VFARRWVFDPESRVTELLNVVIKEAGSRPFDLAVILGSGWSHLADAGLLQAEFPYADWPCFPDRRVSGHDGRLTIIELHGHRILCFAGRFHCYQGLNAFEASLPVRIASALECSRILLTCAVGGINLDFQPGDFVWVSDHINLLGDNPLRGLSEEAFLDLSHLYNLSLFDWLQVHAGRNGIPLHSGVLAAMPGPCYETPAEVRMLSLLGADIVSMSMVHEAIMARYLGLEIAGLSLVANRAAGQSQKPLCHEDVLGQAHLSRKHASFLFEAIAAAWLSSPPESPSRT